MNRPHFLCLMPVWNHRHETIQNALRCFLDQTYKNATLAIIDDRPKDSRIHLRVLEWMSWEGRNVYLLRPQHGKKFPSIAAKYNYALEYMNKHRPLEYTHVVIWDDDDGFTENHLEHAAWHYGTGALWTYPDKVFTTFGGSLNVEPTEGRFWSSITFDRKCLDPWGGLFPDRKNVGQDQMFLGELKTRFGDSRATPTLPTYVYRWGAEGEQHWSGLSRGFDCESSWDACPHSVSGKPLEAVYDEFYVKTRREIEAYYGRERPPTTPTPDWIRLG